MNESSQDRGAHAIYCDEVRIENSGKHILIGVYGDAMIVGEFPALLPTFAIYLCAWTDLDYPFQKIAIRVYVGDEVIYEEEASPQMFETANAGIPEFKRQAAEKKSALPNSVPRLELRRTIRFLGFPIVAETSIRVRIITESEELRAGGLTVKVASPPDVPPTTKTDEGDAIKPTHLPTQSS